MPTYQNKDGKIFTADEDSQFLKSSKSVKRIPDGVLPKAEKPVAETKVKSEKE